MRSLWIKAVVLLAAIWLVAGGIIWGARSLKPTPEALLAYVDSNPVEGKGPTDRAKVIEKTAEKLNCLTYEERREVRISRRLNTFFRGLTPEEQARFLDLTLPEGFRQIMDALNKMTREKRKVFVERTLADLRKQEGQEIPEDAREQLEQDEHVQKIVDQGLKSFYSEASAETKMDLAPVIEQMQRNLQGLR
jgi:hypothetical protein